MLFTRKKSASTAGIELHNGETNSYCWLSDETVNGCAIFDLPMSVDYARSTVILRGTVTTRTADNPAGSFQRDWSVFKHKFLAVALDSRPNPDFDTRDRSIRIPFRFSLSECERHSNTNLALPPSIDSSQAAKSQTWSQRINSTYDYDITYSITASVFGDKGILASCTNIITILPVSDIQNPLPSIDFPGEYFLATSTSSRNKHGAWASVAFNVEAACEEPPPIVVDATDRNRASSTHMDFLVKIAPDLWRHQLPESLPTQCQVKCDLIETTIITPGGGTSAVAPMEELRKGRDNHVLSRKMSEQKYTVAVPKWERFTSGEEFAITRFSILLRMEEGKTLPPTFSTPLLSRRYTIDVTLRFANCPGRQLKLSVPVRIVHQRTEAKIPSYESVMATSSTRIETQ